MFIKVSPTCITVATTGCVLVTLAEPTNLAPMSARSRWLKVAEAPGWMVTAGAV
jgi:hypothetical protein